ncbi:MAG: FecR family protein [Saprospiraceae bacterium]|nr:FecR family protein [Saprospiraceae bacterium]
MNFDEENLYKGKDDTEIAEKKLFGNLHVDYDQSKSQAWEQLSEKITSSTVSESSPKILSFIGYKFLVAACVLLVFGTLVFCNVYTQTIICERGQHLNVELPDGSTVEINASSSLVYKPYWWNFSRTVNLDGEAYFQVKKGSAFTVNSKYGCTEVLGTIFNVYARGNQYEVLCVSGKVGVKARGGLSKSVFLEANEFAVLNNGKLLKTTEVNSSTVVGWKDLQFNFTSKPLKMVIKEVERQFDVDIKFDKNLIYTGSFNKTKSVESTLNLICLPFNLKFVKTGKNTFEIVDKN